MYTVKYLSESDIEGVRKGEIKVQGKWYTIWRDSLNNPFIHLGGTETICIDKLTASAHKLEARY